MSADTKSLALNSNNLTQVGVSKDVEVRYLRVGYDANDLGAELNANRQSFNPYQ